MKKSGFARLDVPERSITTRALAFPDLIDRLAEERDCALRDGRRLLCVVEAGWLNASNWHVHGRTPSHLAAQIGNGVGRNHEPGRKIVEMARHLGLEVEERRPLPLKAFHWKGRGGKITQQELAAITGKKWRCCQDERDAALLAWVAAALPLKL